MGVIDAGVLTQLKKGQAETNERLDALVKAQERTNQLLEWLGGLLAGFAVPPPTCHAGTALSEPLPYKAVRATGATVAVT